MEKEVERCKNYIESHRKLVAKGYEILKPMLEEYLSRSELEILERNIRSHDESKFGEDELMPRVMFYHVEKNEETRAALEAAEQKHKLSNPHHPEYWASLGEEMPKVYVVEMVLDWWTFGLRENNPGEIFDYYNKNKASIPLSKKGQKEVEEIFEMIRNVLEQGKFC